MKLLLTERFTAYALLLLIALTLMFHALIITGVIPFGIVWGGRMKDQAQMLTFETISVAINLVMLGVVAVKAGLLEVRIHPGLIKTALWIMFGLFLLNTLGNLLSKNEVEKMIFTPITLLLSLFSLRLALGKSSAIPRRELATHA
ncbi:hypothetical protein [Hymenobacter sp. BT730]|uniref:hypothetical protein n=1 Tax=Hymenobacter sp. BT730 TaxID=3063332 RepID=UPI0026E0C368|nr:hypothetical protein [Hymenobacter sp. BT730]